jgi:hypothetical protein
LSSSALREGNVIIGFANKKVKNISNFLNVLEKNSFKESVRVLIVMGVNNLN